MCVCVCVCARARAKSMNVQTARENRTTDNDDDNDDKTITDMIMIISDVIKQETIYWHIGLIAENIPVRERVNSFLNFNVLSNAQGQTDRQTNRQTD